MFSLREVLKNLSNELWLCVLSLLAVLLSGSSPISTRNVSGLLSTAGQWSAGTTAEMLATPGLLFGNGDCPVIAGLWAELEGPYEPHMLPSVALLVL